MGAGTHSPRRFSALNLCQWRERELSPSAELRQWFGHQPSRFEVFRRRYIPELRQQRPRLTELRRRARDRTLTLVYSARDSEHNDGVVLAAVLRRGLPKAGSGGVELSAARESEHRAAPSSPRPQPWASDEDRLLIEPRAPFRLDFTAWALHIFPGDDVGGHNKLRLLFGIDKPLGYDSVQQLVARWLP